MKQQARVTLAITILVLSAMPLVALVGVASASTQPENIKVFTNANAYAPMELVQMYANITYSGTALVNQAVAFYVENSNGSVMAIRITSTNYSGIAYAYFRMPMVEQNSNETGFGTWSVTGAVNVTQITLTDTTKFSFGYLSAFGNIQVQASVHKLDYLSTTIPITNLCNSTGWSGSEIDITLFDQAQTPIGSATATNTMTAKEETLNATILIPNWAFTGQATACFCLLTASGVATCPEDVINFQILPSTANTISSSASVVAGPVLALILPEYAYGGLIGLGAAFTGFVAFETFKKMHKQNDIATH
jgi:hypothetical protein